MQLTEKQIEDFNKEKYELTEKIEVYEQGVDFAECWCEVETGKRQWIKILKEVVNSEDFVEKSEQYSDTEFAVLTERYLKDIETPIYQEFSGAGLIKLFDKLLPEYQKRVRKILLKIEV